MKIRSYQHSDESQVVDLWQRCGLLRPWNDPYKDIQRKLAIAPDQFLVGVDEEKVIAAAMIGYDGHRGWIYYLAVSPDVQRQGLGRVLMDEAERRLRVLGCPKINLQVRTSNTQVIDFYRSLGFVEDAVLSFGKRLERDEPDAQ
ncbi:GNAT family acetyltransferase [Schlesneria paludicola]|uniref:GNAT family acetyltransferase n=1 Tax=Schlesneria paludicola TaxID=360056 RepID=UPI00029A82F8|nr:GNAT family acetyltransferase [Schlesneria paludicola]